LNRRAEGAPELRPISAYQIRTAEKAKTEWPSKGNESPTCSNLNIAADGPFKPFQLVFRLERLERRSLVPGSPREILDGVVGIFRSTILKCQDRRFHDDTTVDIDSPPNGLILLPAIAPLSHDRDVHHERS
jgi:hypothetical protein